MSSSSESHRIKQSLNFKYPSKRENGKSGTGWLEGKRLDDEAEGLWRVHDNLYDVSEFSSVHPGGVMWIDLTKGTDITEAFEAHHISSLPEEMLKKYYIRKASKPRNSPFTFKEDGFYRTLKRNAQIALRDVSRDASHVSNLIIDALLSGTFIFAILACKYSSFVFAVASSFLLALTTVAAHNYFHKKDNFRMYYFNLSLMDFREWRISHALSHHLFPNTIVDLEVSTFEPIIHYFPYKKTLIEKYVSYINVIILWILLFAFSYIKRVAEICCRKQPLGVIDTIPFLLPFSMFVFSGASLTKVLAMWVVIICVGSFVFGVIGFNAAHHHPDIFHEGDAPRANEEIDWGLFQLDAVADRYEITGSTFLVLTNFGDHALHHLFPTLDHSTLKYLYPVFKSTMEQFKVELRMKSQLEMVVGQFQQLSRETPNAITTFVILIFYCC
ncbi:hypothetical protein FQA39_LY03070 [Lamprigera yunnana]|nr:hypothetical protein FQA39_LY03070 [Lamprigera yunnana]